MNHGSKIKFKKFRLREKYQTKLRKSRNNSILHN